MKGKKILYSEAAYVIGIFALAFGTALMERADFGMSMVVAPAYLLYLKISESISWFTFGMAEYLLQAVLLIASSIIWRKFKIMYLFSFVTAIIYGFILDLLLGLTGMIPMHGIAGRALFYAFGLMFCAYGVSMLFHTYFAPEAYELLVKEISHKYGFNINKTKMIYDCSSCVIAIIMSFAFFGFGSFRGVKAGTVACALLNGWLIGRFSKLNEHFFEFKDKISKRRFLE